MSINDILIKFIVFIIIILIGMVIGKVVYNLIRKTIKEFELARMLKRIDIKFNPERFLPSLSKYIVYSLAVIIALSTIGITRIVIRIAVIIFMVFIVIYILISIRDFMPNIYYGFKLKRKYKIGKRVRYKNIEGNVIGASLIELRIKTKKEVIHIPYKILRSRTSP